MRCKFNRRCECRECVERQREERRQDAALHGGLAGWALSALGLTEAELMGDDYETAGDDYRNNVLTEG